jgi:hypothetical protein
MKPTSNNACLFWTTPIIRDIERDLSCLAALAQLVHASSGVNGATKRHSQEELHRGRVHVQKVRKRAISGTFPPSPEAFWWAAELRSSRSPLTDRRRGSSPG